MEDDAEMDRADLPCLGEPTPPTAENHRETETPRTPCATGHRSRFSKAFNKLTDGSSKDSVREKGSSFLNGIKRGGSTIRSSFGSISKLKSEFESKQYARLDDEPSSPQSNDFSAEDLAPTETKNHEIIQHQLMRPYAPPMPRASEYGGTPPSMGQARKSSVPSRLGDLNSDSSASTTEGMLKALTPEGRIAQNPNSILKKSTPGVGLDENDEFDGDDEKPLTAKKNRKGLKKGTSSGSTKLAPPVKSADGHLTITSTPKSILKKKSAYDRLSDDLDEFEALSISKKKKGDNGISGDEELAKDKSNTSLAKNIFKKSTSSEKRSLEEGSKPLKKKAKKQGARKLLASSSSDSEFGRPVPRKLKKSTSYGMHSQAYETSPFDQQFKEDVKPTPTNETDSESQYSQDGKPVPSAADGLQKMILPRYSAGLPENEAKPGLRGAGYGNFDNIRSPSIDSAILSAPEYGNTDKSPGRMHGERDEVNVSALAALRAFPLTPTPKARKTTAGKTDGEQDSPEKEEPFEKSDQPLDDVFLSERAEEDGPNPRNLKFGTDDGTESEHAKDSTQSIFEKDIPGYALMSSGVVAQERRRPGGVKFGPVTSIPGPTHGLARSPSKRRSMASNAGINPASEVNVGQASRASIYMGSGASLNQLSRFPTQGISQTTLPTVNYRSSTASTAVTSATSVSRLPRVPSVVTLSETLPAVVKIPKIEEEPHVADVLERQNYYWLPPQRRPAARMSLNHPDTKPTNRERTPDGGYFVSATLAAPARGKDESFASARALSYRASPTPLGPPMANPSTPTSTRNANQPLSRPDLDGPITPTNNGLHRNPSGGVNPLVDNNAIVMPESPSVPSAREDPIRHFLPVQWWSGRYSAVMDRLRTMAVEEVTLAAWDAGVLDPGANHAFDSPGNPANQGMLDDKTRDAAALDELRSLCVTTPAKHSLDVFVALKYEWEEAAGGPSKSERIRLTPRKSETSPEQTREWRRRAIEQHQRKMEREERRDAGCSDVSNDSADERYYDRAMWWTLNKPEEQTAAYHPRMLVGTPFDPNAEADRRRSKKSVHSMASLFGKIAGRRRSAGGK